MIGSGIAGLAAALSAAPRARVALITRAALDDGCTRWAQGGIAAAVGSDDSSQRHFDDTIAAGRGLCDAAAVRVLVEGAPMAVERLRSWGVGFDTDEQGLAVGREAAHSRSRIVHAGGDATGASVEGALVARVRRSGVQVVEDADVVRLLTTPEGNGVRCIGMDMYEPATGALHRLTASATVLATGGAGRLWRTTTNPEQATGSGVALAYEIGAEVAGMEFMQFHPTALALAGAPHFLISEAVRGEGAHVVDDHGQRFLFDVDPQGELAGRDVVAQAIWRRLDGSGAGVWLDCAPLGERTAARFPTIHRTLLRHGIDMGRDRIPIAPAAHYLIGGVRTDVDGATSVAGLHACGEVASTGVHGANRLASNSLLEGAVFGPRAAEAALHANAERQPVHAGGEQSTAPTDDATASSRLDVLTAALREAMWAGCGVVRDAAGIAATRGVVDGIRGELTDTACPPAVALRAAATTASLVTAAAFARTESRGAQLRSDFPLTTDDWHGTWVMHVEKGAHLDRNS